MITLVQSIVHTLLVVVYPFTVYRYVKLVRFLEVPYILCIYMNIMRAP